MSSRMSSSMHVCMHVCMYVCMFAMHTCLHACMCSTSGLDLDHECGHMADSHMATQHDVNVFKYACMYACLHA